MHICMDEVMAFITALPIVGYCWRCVKAKLTLRKACAEHKEQT